MSEAAPPSVQTTSEPDPVPVIAASSWAPGAAEMGIPPGSRRRPAALTRAAYTSGPVDGERSSCHTTTKLEPSNATAGARWFPAAFEIGTPTGSSTTPASETRAA